MTWAASAIDYATAASVLNEVEVYYSQATTGLAARLLATRATVVGRYAIKAFPGLDAYEALATGLLGEGAARGILDPLLQEWVYQGAEEPVAAGAEDNWRKLYDYMIGSGDDVNSRAWTMGTPSAGGGNVGNATCLRLATDEESEPMEGWWPDAYTLEAETDALGGGEAHRATWKLYGDPAEPTIVGFGDSGLEEHGIEQLSDLQSVGRVSNPNFAQGTFSGATITTLTGWTIAGSNVETNTTSTYIYLDTTNGGTPRSIRFIGNDTVSQNLITQAGLTLDADTPYLVGYWHYRRDSGDGTMTLRLANGLSGGVSRAVVTTTLSNAAWTFFALVATPGANCWPANFRAQDLTLSFNLASYTTGSHYASNVIFAPWYRAGSRGQAARGRGCLGVYLAPLAGSTQTIVGDLFTWTDSEGTRAKVQYVSGPHIAGYGYLPNDNAAGETVADV